MLIKEKHVEFDYPIPANSKIAITDISYENRNYNVRGAPIRVSCFLTPAMHYKFFKKHTMQQSWHEMTIHLTMGIYRNLKDFISECLRQASKKEHNGERVLVERVFARFTSSDGRLKVLPSRHNNSKLQYRIKFDNEIAACLGLPTPEIFINNAGRCPLHLFYRGLCGQINTSVMPKLGLINFTVKSVFPITCAELKNEVGNKALAHLYIKNHLHKVGYTQIKELTYHNLISCNFKALNFDWPDNIKILFLNISILPSY